MNRKHIFDEIVLEAETDLAHNAKTFPESHCAGKTVCGKLFYWNAMSEAFPEIKNSNAVDFCGYVPKDPHVVTCIACAAMR